MFYTIYLDLEQEFNNPKNAALLSKLATSVNTVKTDYIDSIQFNFEFKSVVIRGQINDNITLSELLTSLNLNPSFLNFTSFDLQKRDKLLKQTVLEYFSQSEKLMTKPFPDTPSHFEKIYGLIDHVRLNKEINASTSSLLVLLVGCHSDKPATNFQENPPFLEQYQRLGITVDVFRIDPLYSPIHFGNENTATISQLNKYACIVDPVLTNSRLLSTTLAQKMRAGTKIIVCDNVSANTSDFTHQLYLNNKNQLHHNLEIISFYIAVENQCFMTNLPPVIQFSHSLLENRNNILNMFQTITNRKNPVDRVKQQLHSQYQCGLFDVPQAITPRDLFKLLPLRINSSLAQQDAISANGADKFGLFAQSLSTDIPSIQSTQPTRVINENSGLLSDNRKCNICTIV